MKWTKVKDELPKTDDNVIFNYKSIIGGKYDDNNNVTIGCYMNNIGLWYRHDDIQIDYVTHWMPLPTKPK